ncbi:rhodanese-like domain-containing protein [Seonamhaeicola maritimus]|uniref:Rhodanese-like domain-containing protein n=1 Tax=Seonamhaeicola maritimus TaxID=2591822 RepID=A0A5C7GDU2_9FLAO|nr:rhodanese-like domain-containing protein [Seonamhaeicola maritimus]TXG34719.1 rhodanese-like domain-containing protein [Seonamhaeicola maritimus]
MKLLSYLFGNKKEMIEDFKNRGAIIVDVRTPQEYTQGAIKGSKNIPLQSLNSKIDELRRLKKPVITCCASGMRSGSACSILKPHGIEVLNGGGWQSLSRRL